jgi:hypothetical protein
MCTASSSSHKGEENSIIACRLAKQQSSPRGREVRAFASYCFGEQQSLSTGLDGKSEQVIDGYKRREQRNCSERA